MTEKDVQLLIYGPSDDDTHRKRRNRAGHFPGLWPCQKENKAPEILGVTVMSI